MRKSTTAIPAERAPATRRPALAYGPALLLALALAGLTLYAYRSLPGRPFAADDYQWLLNVQERDLGSMLRAAFDPAVQTHFYRPLVWALFWGQLRLFDLEPRGFHWVSLALHLLNAALLGALAHRLAKLRMKNAELRNPARSGQVRNFSILNSQFSIRTQSFSILHSPFSIPLAAGVAALHPAPFEAVVWVSSQSELAAAALLLLMLHLWLFRAGTKDEGRRTKDEGRTTNDEGRRTKDEALPSDRSTALPLQRSTAPTFYRSTAPALLATLALGLALLAKESAVIGLPLLVLAELWIRSRWRTVSGQASEPSPPSTQAGEEPASPPHPLTPSPPHPAALLLPLLLTLGYLLLQIGIERRNYLLAGGGYGLGPQLALNPLRSLGLLAAPLPGTEYADAAWLVPLGAAVALVLLAAAAVLALRRRYGAPLLGAALALTLLPTAPFVSPPDSRYLYLPALAAALILGLALAPRTANHELSDTPARSLQRLIALPLYRFIALPLLLLLAWPAAGEIAARENRFAGATGPGGSLWRLTAELCAAESPQRILVVEPPLAPPHAEAIVRLACGPHVRPVVVGRDKVEGALRPNSVVVAFPGGSAAIERHT